jgi:hypothetical protein
MAGRARYIALTDELNRRVADTFDPEPADQHQPNALDYVCHWMESGKTAKGLAADLSAKLAFDVDYAMLLRYLRNTFGEGATESAMDVSRARASHSLAEDALELIDAADKDSSSAVSKASSQARSRQWMAERYNPSRFGQKTQQTVSISIGALHLEALKAHPKNVTGGVMGSFHNTTLANAAVAEVVALPSVGTAPAPASSHNAQSVNQVDSGEPVAAPAAKAKRGRPRRAAGS